MLQIGEKPTKKNTGELEPILPEWLRDVRQQARESAEEDAAQPKVQKNEPPDLLAGLASQAGADDDAIPDWLAGINPATTAKPSESPAREPDSSMAQEDRLSLMGKPEDQSDVREEKDELSEWFSRASEQPGEPLAFEPGESQDDLDLMGNLDASAASVQQPTPPKEQEDLGWLHDLEASSKRSAEPLAPRPDLGSMPDDASSQPSSEKEDLSWLNNLGGISEPSQPFDQTQGRPLPAQPAAPQEDMSWLDNLGGTLEPSQPTQPPAAPEDLSWLNDLGGTSELPKPELAKPSSDVPDFSSPILSPRRTAPLSEEAENESLPDWLKSATEEPSMPPLGAGALNWFASHDLDGNQPAATQESPASLPGEMPGLSEETPPPPFGQAQEIRGSTASSESPPASNQDVDSLFSMDVPDWLSNPESGLSEVSLQGAEIPPAEAGESLAPVELPSWVQAMRPVEAFISESAAGTDDQALEREGPLAGLRGVIPLLPIGSSRRPKALSLTLQATAEQQAGAALLEQILAGETTPRPLVTTSSVVSQNILRWVLTGLVMVVLGAMIGLRSRGMPVSTALPVEVSAASNAVTNIAEDSPVLVVVDYEPALAGEMEAVSGPLLDNMVLLRHPKLSFLATSPNGSALVERLVTHTKINGPAPDGLGYQPGMQYFNLGYLPGGSAGVLAFIQSPQTAMPAADVENFAQYAAVIVLTDHAESGRMWVEQLDARKQSDPALASQPLVMVASAQAGPLLQPYVSSRQVAGMISGLPDAARYESVNNVPPGMVRTYWDAFGIGLLLAVILITFGSLWSLFTGIRLRRAGAEQA